MVLPQISDQLGRDQRGTIRLDDAQKSDGVPAQTLLHKTAKSLGSQLIRVRKSRVDVAEIGLKIGVFDPVNSNFSRKYQLFPDEMFGTMPTEPATDPNGQVKNGHECQAQKSEPDGQVDLEMVHLQVSLLKSPTFSLKMFMFSRHWKLYRWGAMLRWG